jgi:cation diffusion facilitator family transporter
MIVLASYIIYRSYMQFVDPHEIEVPFYGAVIALIAALIAWALGIKKYMEGKETKMSSLKLDAYNTIKDGTASFMAVIALMLSAYGYPVADAIVGFIIAGIILSIGFATIKESSYILVDACDAECIDHGFVLSAMVEDQEEVKAAHIVRLRRTGPVLLGEIEIKVSGKMSVAELYKLREKIEKMAKKEIPDIERLTVTAIPFENE